MARCWDVIGYTNGEGYALCPDCASKAGWKLDYTHCNDCEVEECPGKKNCIHKNEDLADPIFESTEFDSDLICDHCFSDWFDSKKDPNEECPDWVYIQKVETEDNNEDYDECEDYGLNCD